MSNYQYGGNSIALEVAIKQIKLYKDALALCPKVMEVVKKFDGKVANKRLETALEAVDKGFYCRKSQWGDDWEIKWYTQDRSVNVKSINLCGMETYNAYYIRQSEIYFARDMFEKTYGAFTDANGRWLAENICKQIEAEAEGWKQNIEQWEQELKHVDELREKKRKLEAEIEAHNEGISWLINEYFSLRVEK